MAGGTGSIDPFAAMRAAMEAARKAAEEAARRAAAEAAKRAAEAAKRASEAARHEQSEAAKAALQAQQAKDNKETSRGAKDIGDLASGVWGAMPWVDAPPPPPADLSKLPPAAKKLAEGVSLEDLKADPQLAKDIAALQDSKDLDVQAVLQASAQEWVESALDQAVANGEGQDPAKVFEGFKTDLQALADSTGLGKVMGAQVEDTMKEAAVELLESKPSMAELTKNPAKAQLMATLAQDPQYKGQLEKQVKAYASNAISHNLEGKERESGAKKAADDTVKEMLAFAEASGLGEMVKKQTGEAFEDAEDAFKETAEKGKHWYEKVGGFFGDLLGDVGDFLGKGLDALGDVANAAFDAAGDLSQNLANAAAVGLDAVGADQAANATRHVGAASNAVLDAAGQVTNTGLDIAGTAVADGPAGIANLAMDAALGPEKPEYAGELDGVTGAITNRLGEGDSVYLSVSGGAKVGVAAYAEMSAGGEASLSRNSDGTLSLTIEGSVTGGVGVSAESKIGGGVEAGDMEAGASAKATASAGVEAKGMGRMTMTFDPKNPADAARLKALIEPDAGRIAAAATNPMAAIAIGGNALADAVAHNRESFTLGGSVGAKASAGVSAEAGPVSAEVGVDAKAVVGTATTWNADGSTDSMVYMNASASISAELNAGPVGVEAGAGVRAAVGMTITRDAAGNVTGVATEHGAAASGTVGVSAGKAKGGQNTSVKEKERLTAAGVAEFNRLVAAGENQISAYRAARKDPANIETVTSTTTTNEFSIGAKGEVGVLGVQVGVSGNITFGKSHTDTEVDEPSSVLDNSLNRGFTADPDIDLH